MENNILEKYRNQIDFFDSEIVNLLHERFEIVKLIGEYKKNNNIKALQEDRFKKILEKVTNQADEL
jgi:chorismate mutase